VEDSTPAHVRLLSGECVSVRTVIGESVGQLRREIARMRCVAEHQIELLQAETVCNNEEVVPDCMINCMILPETPQKELRAFEDVPTDAACDSNSS